jgi:hypothetical protein
MENLNTKYRQEKAKFLDHLSPDDFRNGGSFNQAEEIIERLNQQLYKLVQQNGNPDEFIKKALNHLFRDGSEAAEKAINLSRIYLQMMAQEG